MKKRELPAADQFHPLILAAMWNEIDAVRQYLNANVDPDYVSNGITALWIAAQQGNYEIAELLIQAGADVNFKHPIGQSVLWTAALKGHFMLVRLLLSNGSRANDLANHASPLWVAVQNNHLDTVRELLGVQCDVNLPYECLNQTPLFKAALLGLDAIVLELINAHADVNLADSSGTTPLMAASDGGHLNCVNALLLKGAQVNAVNKVGKTALSFANISKFSSVANRLTQAGAQVDLSYSRIGQQFINYLNLIAKLFPEKYNLKDIETIKGVVSPGLCYGFSMLLAALPESSWASLYADLSYISKWDGSEDNLRSDKKLQDLCEELIGTLVWLHRRHGLLANGELEQGESLINVITENKKEVLFNFGFLLKANEIKNVLQMILEPGKKIELGSVLQDSHSILLTKGPSGEYILCDDNSGIGPIILHSLENVVETIYLMFGNNVSGENPLGIKFAVYDAKSSPDKQRYAEYKAKILDSIIADRLEHDELNLFNDSNINALNCAVYRDDEETVLKLLKSGAVINQEAKYYMLPVYMAAYHGNVRILDQLVQHISDLDLNGSSTEGFPLLVAAMHGRTSAIRFLIHHGVQINRQDAKGAGPLMAAAQNGHLESVIALVEGGADVNYLSKDGRSALFMACMSGHFEIVEYLAQHGADIDPKSYFCRPIDAAIANGHLNVVEGLAKLGVNFSLKNSKDLTPLTLAEFASQPRIVDYIKSQVPQNPGKSEHTLFGSKQATEQEENSCGMVFMDPVVPTNTFRGGIQEYLEQYNKLGEIRRIELTGQMLALGVYERSGNKLNPEQLVQFLKIIHTCKIKELSFMGCTLDPLVGKILGEALKENDALEKLEVCSNQLQEQGIISILEGLKSNQSLKTLISRSYNIDRYYWSNEEIGLLKDVLLTNRALTNIVLPNNELSDAEQITFLTEIYSSMDDRDFAEVSGFGLRSSVKLPAFNKENVFNNSLDDTTRIKFMS